MHKFNKIIILENGVVLCHSMPRPKHLGPARPAQFTPIGVGQVVRIKQL